MFMIVFFSKGETSLDVMLKMFNYDDEEDAVYRALLVKAGAMFDTQLTQFAMYI